MSARRTRTFLLLAVVLLTSAGEPAAQDWSGVQDIVLGDSATSVFNGGTMAESHVYRFFAPAGTKLKVRARPDDAPGLKLKLELRDASNHVVEVGKPGRKGSSSLPRIVLETCGTYEVVVTADAGTGSYGVVTRGKHRKRHSETTSLDEFEFSAVADTKMTARIRPARKSPVTAVEFHLLHDPNENKALLTGTKVKQMPLLLSGQYDVGWTTTGGPGPVKLKLKLDVPRSRVHHDLGSPE